MVTRHRCSRGSLSPAPRKPVWYSGLMSWMKGFQIFNFSCVSWKEGTMLEWLICKGKMRKKERERGEMGKHDQRAVLKMGCVGLEWTLTWAQRQHSPGTSEPSPGLVARPAHEDKEVNTMWLLLAVSYWELTSLHTPPLYSHTHPVQAFIIAI